MYQLYLSIYNFQFSATFDSLSVSLSLSVSVCLSLSLSHTHTLTLFFKLNLSGIRTQILNIVILNINKNITLRLSVE